MKAVYKFAYHARRGGSLKGIFIEHKSKVRALIRSGEDIYFGECLGKHSEVCFPLEEEHITMVTDDPEEVALVERLGLTMGYNPVQVFEERTEDEDLIEKVFGKLKKLAGKEEPEDGE